jgi:hypothetical protein
MPRTQGCRRLGRLDNLGALGGNIASLTMALTSSFPREHVQQSSGRLDIIRKQRRAWVA